MNDMEFALQTFLDTHDVMMKMNVVTGEVVILKHPFENIPSNTVLPGMDLLSAYRSFSDFHPDDLYKFELHFNPLTFKQRCDNRQSGTLFSFRKKINGEYRWIRAMVSIPDSYSEESPYVLLFSRILPVWESDQEEAMAAFQTKLHKVIKCNLTDNTFRVIKQRPSESYIKRKHNRFNVLPEEWVIEEGLIHPNDIEHFKHFTDPAFVLDFFKDGNEEISFFYRRKIGSFFRWVKLSITRSSEYEENNQMFLYIIEDIDMILTNLLNQHGFFQYSSAKSSQSSQAEIYYDNILHVLSYFTQRYIEFYMVDLRKDLYIMYKITQDNINGELPYVGSYTDLAKEFILSRLSKDQQEKLLPYSSSDSLREQLMDRASIEFSFVHANGQPVKTICTKIESLNGIPSKIICCTVPAQEERRLKVKTFGNFQVLDEDGKQLKFTRKQAKELFAYLIDRQGYPVSSQDIIQDIFEKSPDDLNAVKYVSTLYRSALKDLEKVGYPGIIVKEWNSLRVDTDKLDCDYYHLLHGDASYLYQYHNEYMKEYSWAEETNAEILHYSSR